jgi:hypothetical protein
MRVSQRRLTIGQNPNKVNAVILEPRMIAEAPGIALRCPSRNGSGELDALLSDKSAGLNTFDPLAMVASS